MLLTLWLLVTLVGGAKESTLPLRAAAMTNAEMVLDLNIFAVIGWLVNEIITEHTQFWCCSVVPCVPPSPLSQVVHYLVSNIHQRFSQ